MIINSGTGNGQSARVDTDKRLATTSVNLPRQHFISKVRQGAYQVVGTATAASGNVTVLTLSPDRPRRIAARGFLRVGLRTMTELRDRLAAEVLDARPTP